MAEQLSAAELVVSLEAMVAQVSSEAFNPMALPGAFSKIVGEVRQSFSGLFGFLDTGGQKQQLEPVLTSAQRKFNDLIATMPYTSVGELPAFTPEGMKSSYVEFLKLLEQASVQSQSLEKEVLAPYVQFLAQFISNAKIQHDTFTDQKRISAYVKATETLYHEFSKHYGKASYAARVRVKNVVARNGDWKEVFDRLNRVIAAMERVNRKVVQQQIKQCVDYLAIIERNFGQAAADVSPEATQRLAQTALMVAKMLELYSTTHYRALTIQGAIENTMESVKKAIG